MRNINLSSMIASMSAVALLGLATIALVFLSSVNDLKTYFERGSQLSRLEEMVVASSGALENARSIQVEFRQNPKIEHYQAFTNQLATSNGHIETFVAALDKDKQTSLPKQNILEVKNISSELHDKFKSAYDRKLKIGLNDESGLQGRFRADVNVVEKELNTLRDDALTVQMLTMRNHEKDFILHVDQKYFTLQQNAAANFKKALAGAGLAPSYMATFQAPMDSYQSSLAQFTEERLALENEYGQLAALNEKISASILGLRTMIASDARLARAEAGTALQHFSFVMWTCIILTILAMLVAAVVITRAIRSPIMRLTSSMSTLAEGNLEIGIADVGRTDEIGNMARSLSHFCAMLREKEKMDLALSHEARHKVVRSQKLEQLFSAFEADMTEMSQTMVSSTEEMSETANSLVDIAERTSGLSACVSATTMQSASSVHLIATASEELAVSIEQISSSLGQSVQDSTLALGDVQAADTCTKSLKEGVDSISSIVGIIENPVSQTNLLALNATIEAARAGHAGRGFAVVAQEVKVLAAQTAGAAQDINVRIASIGDESMTSVMAVSSVNEKMNGITSALTEIGFAIDQQRLSTREISCRVQEIAAGTREASSRISDVDSGASITRESATQMRLAAEKIAEQSSLANGRILDFVKAVRAA